MNILKIIQARIQSIMFNKKVLQMISSASEILLVLKWYHHKQNQTWIFVLIGTSVFGVFKITQIKRI
jgi:spore coat polysaccharide biosynthesis protein SpsF (cytidylyltransferase family)